MFRLALVGFYFFVSVLSATASDELTKVGNTSYMGRERDGNCYQLTKDTDWQSGAIWSTKKVDVTNNFSFASQVYLGSNDAGADGIAFVLQDNDASQTFSEGGRWYATIPHALVVEIDTYFNDEENINDGTREDHMQLTYTSTGNDDSEWGKLSDEVDMPNLEDGKYHDFVVAWDAASKFLTVSLDNELLITESLEEGISHYLNGSTEAWFGFTAATGGESNDQRVCYSNESVEQETSAPTPVPIRPPPGGSGDPHFRMWSGERYDFHGACDLVLLQNPGFDNGLGMDIHIRTKFTLEWSYIATAVLRIGDETFEVMGGEKNSYWINKVEGEDLDHGISGFSITSEEVTSKSRHFRVNLMDGLTVVFKTFRDFVRVDIEGGMSHEFVGSRGLMGDVHGGKVARDLQTMIDDDNEAFGLEWQVLETESMIFHNVEGVQAPEKCSLPSASSRPKRRRLGETTITIKEAEIACARVREDDQDACIFDVLATNSKDMAGAY